MPPSRRRPVPTPPTARPKVAGLRKRPGATPANTQPTDAQAADAQAADPRVADAQPAEGQPADAQASDPRSADPRSAEDQVVDDPAGEGAPARSSEALGLIEPRDDLTGDETAGGDTAEDLTARDATTGTTGTTATPAPGPRPRGRHKRAGESIAPSVLDEDEAAGTASPPATRSTRSAPATPSPSASGDPSPSALPALPALRNPFLPVALLVVAALLVGLGAWFQHRAGEVRYNQALVDSAGTTEVAGQAREAVEKAFSYNFADVAGTEEAANELLVGKAQCQYNAIFGPVRTLAPEQKLVVTVKAVSSGVTSLDGDRATVLLFLDQVTTRTTDNQSGGGIAMMRVGAQRLDGRWKVDNMEMFGQSGDQAAETAKC
ncbi:hypothetical protein GCM10009634_24150 [Saccharothrix xinjiangensis]